MKTVVVLASAALLCSCGIMSPIAGNGVLVEGTASLSGFTAVSASSGFSLTLVPGEFAISITTDENILPYVVLERSGSELSIGMRPGFSYLPTALEATLTLPQALVVSLSGGCSATLGAGFPPSESFVATASGGSSLLVEEVRASQALFELSGGSGVSGTVGPLPDPAAGEAEEGKPAEGTADWPPTDAPALLTLVLSGGSSASEFDGVADRLWYQHSGGGSSYLEGLEVREAEVELSGGSEVWLRVRETLEADLSGGSRLYYAGSEASVVIARAEVSGGSFISTY
jgi:hypothetical protein